MNENQLTLAFADVCRDGGSLAAVFLDAKKPIAFFLQVTPWDDHRTPRTFESLWLSEGELPNPVGQEITPCSAKEKVWLIRFLHETDTSKVGESDREQFKSFVSALAARNDEAA